MDARSFLEDLVQGAGSHFRNLYVRSTYTLTTGHGDCRMMA